VDAESQIIKQDPSYARSPELRMRLAEAYTQANVIRPALTSYLEASDAYLQVGNPEKARQLIQLAIALAQKHALPIQYEDLDRLVQAAEQRKRVWKVQVRGPVAAIAVGQQPNRLYTLGAGRLYGWNLDRQSPEPLLAGSEIAVAGSVLQTADNASRLFAANGPNIKVFGPLLNSTEDLIAHPPSIRNFAVNCDGSVFATVNASHEVKLWDKNGKLLHTLEGPEAKADFVALNSRGDRLFVVAGSQISRWDVERAALQTKMGAKGVPVLSIAVARDDAFLAAGLADGRIQIWGIPSCELRREWKAHSSATSGISLSSNGRWLVSRGADHAVHLWDVKDGKETVRLGNPAPPRAVALSSDDRFLFIAVPLLENAAEIYVWDARLWLAR
jgi:hypothetical protein